MRTPKYKAYVKEYDAICDVQMISFLNDNVLVNISEYNNKQSAKPYSFDEVELMEYTGIENYYNNQIIFDEEFKMNGYITLSEGCYVVRFKNANEYYLKDCQYSKIIGNIYQNKELIG